MNVFEENNLRNRVWGPAAEKMGRRMEEYVTATGPSHGTKSLHPARQVRHLRQHCHPRMGATPRNSSSSTVLAGDAETVRRFYAGTTDDTHSFVRRFHGLG